MTPKKFYNTEEREKVRQVAERAGTNLDNFKQIALYKGSVSRKLAKALSESSGGEMSVLEILFQDDYDDQAA